MFPQINCWTLKGRGKSLFFWCPIPQATEAPMKPLEVDCKDKGQRISGAHRRRDWGKGRQMLLLSSRVLLLGLCKISG